MLADTTNLGSNLGAPTTPGVGDTGPNYEELVKVQDILTKIDLTSPIKTIKEFGALLIGEVINIAKAVKELDEESSRLVRSLGVGKERAGELSSTIARAIPRFVELGMGIGDAGDAYNNLIKSLDTNIMVSDETLANFAATSRVTGVEQKELAEKFRDVGVSVGTIGVQMLDVVKIARQAGTTVEAVSKGVVANLDKMNLYNFEGGIKGLASMSAQASRLGVDMSKIFTVVDKVFNPEGAIEFAASLQRLGVTSSQLLDPLRLMDLAQNDPTELQNQIVNMTKSFTRFNEENNQIEILPGSKRRIDEIGKSMGLVGGELQKMAINAGMFEMKLKQIKFPSSIANKEDRELIATMAQINEKGIATVQIETKRTDETGKIVGTGLYETKEVGKLDEQDVKDLANQQKGQAQSMEKIAFNQLDELKKINATIGKYQAALRFGGASSIMEQTNYQGIGKSFEEKFGNFLENQLGKETAESMKYSSSYQYKGDEIVKTLTSLISGFDMSGVNDLIKNIQNFTNNAMSAFGIGGSDTEGSNSNLIQTLNNPNLNISYEPMTITTDNKFSVDFKVSTDEKISKQAEQDINKAVSDYFNGPDSTKNMSNLLNRIDDVRITNGQKPIFKKGK